MNLYLLTVDGKLTTWDCYISQVVAAETEVSARRLCFVGDEAYYLSLELSTPEEDPRVNPWLDSEWCEAKLIGKAIGIDTPGVICSNFNAG